MHFWNYHEDRGSKLLRNITPYIPVYQALFVRKHKSSKPLRGRNTPTSVVHLGEVEFV